MRFLLIALLLVSGCVQAQKKIAITIDDLPTVSNYYRTSEQKVQMTHRLLKHLKDHKAPAIGFVIGRLLYSDGQPDKSQLALLTKWLDAGVELGNHTYAHKDINQISSAEYAEDVIKGEQLTKDLVERRGKSFRYFRHPFLRKGPTQAKKDSIEQLLTQRGYREAPVTVDNSDYLFSRAYDNALLQDGKTLAAEVGRQYIAYMTSYIDYYEAQSDSLFGRQIPQTLLLHANAINADYLGQLLTALHRKGYSFVSLDEALKDPAYQSADRYVGKGGISWLHRWALTQGKQGAFFKGEPEVPATINELVQRNP
ncbi:polysaccharide deacetylase family protein [Nibrella saemangeumensis]|uniref:Polysaccharide deacetylase family protein n=1 Tax=Nibrella saemangeumensis TaxID=1084526 RepID=A0ABP8NCY9_9BACT